MWKCRKCGKEFNMKPLGHGDLVGNPFTGFKNEKCDGEVVEITS